jgi:hypothetical protein
LDNLLKKYSTFGCQVFVKSNSTLILNTINTAIFGLCYATLGAGGQRFKSSRPDQDPEPKSSKSQRKSAKQLIRYSTTPYGQKRAFSMSPLSSFCQVTGPP